MASRIPHVGLGAGVSSSDRFAPGERVSGIRSRFLKWWSAEPRVLWSFRKKIPLRYKIVNLNVIIIINFTYIIFISGLRV